jgi:hypothetical protein
MNCASVLSCHPRESGGSRNAAARVDSRLRGNDTREQVASNHHSVRGSKASPRHFDHGPPSVISTGGRRPEWRNLVANRRVVGIGNTPWGRTHCIHLLRRETRETACPAYWFMREPATRLVPGQMSRLRCRSARHDKPREIHAPQTRQLWSHGRVVRGIHADTESCVRPCSVILEASHPRGPLLRLDAAGLGPGAARIELLVPFEGPELLEPDLADGPIHE